MHILNSYKSLARYIGLGIACLILIIIYLLPYISSPSVRSEYSTLNTTLPIPEEKRTPYNFLTPILSQVPLARARVYNKPPHPLSVYLGVPMSKLRIINNNGAGDCFFHAVSEALRQAGQDEDVASLRETVAFTVDQDKYETLRATYDMALKENDSALLSDYSFMRHAGSLEQLKQIIRTNVYYGDEMAIRAIEQGYGIRCLIINQDIKGNITLARRLIDEEEEEYDRFIMLVLNTFAQHYELLEYGGLKTLTREQLPPKLRRRLDAIRTEIKEIRSREEKK